MKNKAITIPRISYAIQNDEVLLEQWADHGELMKVNLHKIQIMNISEQMGIQNTKDSDGQCKALADSLSDLFWQIESYWQAVSGSQNQAVDVIADIRAIYYKAVSACQLIGLDPATMRNPLMDELVISNRRNQLGIGDIPF